MLRAPLKQSRASSYPNNFLRRTPHVDVERTDVEQVRAPRREGESKLLYPLQRAQDFSFILCKELQAGWDVRIVCVYQVQRRSVATDAE